MKENEALIPVLSTSSKTLIDSGYITEIQLRLALAETRKNKRPLTEVLKLITGHSLSPELLKKYKKQQLIELEKEYNVKSFDIDENEISILKISALIDEFIPVDICSRYKLIPLMLNKDMTSILIAMVDPDNLEACDDLSRLLRTKKITIKRIVITREDFEELISRYRDGKLDSQIKEDYQKSVDISKLLLNENPQLDTITDNDIEDVASSNEDIGKVTKFVNVLIGRALQEDVSDIHLEALENSLRIRFRKDGVLSLAYPEDTLSKSYASSISTRIKIMSDLNISEKRLPQDGKFRRKFMGRKIDFRVSTLPSRFGETIVIRVLDNKDTQLSLDNLVTCPETAKNIRELINNPYGLLLVTGPTGSGKTTTLYSILSERNTVDVNIVSVEDPIEYSLPGITQVQLLREKGLNFSVILKAFLRQDPNLIFVGECRDTETAKTVTEAALTGHLVLTTLHTNSAAACVSRLTEMGVEPFILAGTLLGVLAQRLVRRVCTDCCTPYKPTEEELHYFSMPNEDLIFYQANKLTVEEVLKAKIEGSLCRKCQGLGYKGRVGVYELMKISHNMQTLICDKVPTNLLEEAAIKEGMITLLSYSLNLVKQGVTTLEEVKRVTFVNK